ncbi:IclR family transcriptional regulator [Bacillus sp. ISL-75]|uniref:IclR family transcriptional regulator n=1 Tax=Bacillus sp. ISL-75 TaxID=2819137 RepID=UPI001BE8BB2C|nr:IclR family transcriptional regulator [Bacillus sp. ISL-75]MBT2726386.1 IclR family transcriptional regulator [Bacillus sp. ISL-75]
MSVKSAERVLQVFELLAHNPDGLLIKEISEKLSFPQSSTSNLIATLLKQGYLSLDSMKKYKLGAKLVHIGTMAMENLDISLQAKPYLEKLMQSVQETVFMATLSGEDLVYLTKINSNRSIRTTAQTGYSKPLYCTGLGKTFLANMADEERKGILDRVDLVSITAKTITNREELEKELYQYSLIGYTIDDEENEEGLYCVAAPIFGADRRIQAAISVAGPKERMLAQKAEVVERVLWTSKKISESIGCIL